MGTLVLQSDDSELEIWPASPRSGQLLYFAFREPARVGAEDGHEYEITIRDELRRQKATIARGRLRSAGGVVSVSWDGRIAGGARAPAGLYVVRVVKLASSFRLERTVVIKR